MTKPKKDKTLQVRLTKEDYKLLQIAAYTTGNTPSKLMRMLMDASINAVKVQINKGAMNLEDFKGIFND